MRRRLAQAGALAMGLSLVLGACSSGGTGGGDGGDGGSGGETTTLTFATFGGAYEEAQRAAWLDAFTAETGIEVVFDAYDFSKLQTMVEAGDVIWDVVDTSGENGLESTSEWLEPIDCTVVTTCDTPAAGLVNTEWRVAQNTSAMVFAYNTEKAGGEPQNWADFFDTEKFPGKRGFPAWVSGGTIEAALLADGVAADQLYPLDVDRALAKLDTIKDDIIWWESGTQSEELLTSGETVFSLVFSPRAYQLNVVNGAPVQAQWHNVLTIGNYTVIPKGTKNLAAAQQLVAWISDPANNANISLHYPVGPGTEGSTVDVPAEIEPWLPTEHLDTAVTMDDAYWDESFGDVNATFQDWLQQ